MSPATISYPFHAGGQIRDRRWWMAVVDGEIYDYNTKAALIEDLEAEGIPWRAMRTHRDGTTSVIEEGGGG